jgi:acetoin:2,6-dichlorophenolindophenol oxidoreductase subunit alpha
MEGRRLPKTRASRLAARASNAEEDSAELVKLLRRMSLIRAFDSKLPNLYTQGFVRGSSHAALGQEAVAVGACAALESTDYITSTHRGHGHAIAKGADVRRMMAELFGRAEGYCRGKGGSMHIADFAIAMLGANGIVGGGFGIAAGAALASALRGDGRVTLCFFGEGAINKGAFHEIANLASIWKLPLIFLCENNQFAMSARVGQMTSIADLHERAKSYGFPGCTIDGMDVLAVRDAVAEATAGARSGNGPRLVVATCYRFAGHFSGDLMPYRQKEEAAPWLARDPIALFRASLVQRGVLTDGEADRVMEEAEEAIADAIDFAKASPWPDPGTALEDVHA